MIIHSVPMLSTAHITEEENIWLLRDPFGQLWSVVAPYEGGFFINPKELRALADDFDQDIPDGVEAVIHWAIQNKYDWIRLDRDGDTVPELPQYDW